MDRSWRYFAEGGAHVVFSSRDPSTANRAQVLKVPKIKPGRTSHLQYNLQFLTHTIGAWFGEKYFHPPAVLSLSSEDVQQLLACTIEGRCPARARSEPHVQLACWAFLEPNLCLPSSLCPSPLLATVLSLSPADAVISFELKVKCGLKASSPFVAPDNHLKVQVDKFSWMQRYKRIHCTRSGSSAMPWGNMVHESTYHPRDLCSREPDRVRRALRLLSQCPQNNLKVSINGQHVYGWDKLELSALAETIPEQSPASVESFLEPHLQTLAGILTTEDLLSRLELLQCIDLLDAEGCQEAYRELHRRWADRDMDTCLGEHFAQPIDLHAWQALAMMGANAQTSFDIPTGSPPPQGMWLPGEMFVPILELSALRINAHTSYAERCLRRERATDWLRQCTDVQLAEVLKMSMAAMIAKDASVIVTFPMDGGPSASREAVLGLIDVSLKAVSKLESTAEKEREVLALLLACEEEEKEEREGIREGRVGTDWAVAAR